MAKIFKFPKSKELYSQKFIKNINPNAIGDFIHKQHPDISIRAADAMALAIIYSTHLQLVFEEEGSAIPIDIMNKFEENDHEMFLWSKPKHTLH
tara:strand:- start:176 stop:457 length:282 start_codon:yes stop_codon:yes gene_type:complete